MSPNIPESEAAGRKRSHDQFTEAAFEVAKGSEDASNQGLENQAIKQENNAGSLQDIPTVSITEPGIKRERSSSPSVSSDSELSSLGSIRGSPAPDDKDLTPSTSPMAPGVVSSANNAPEASSTTLSPSSTVTPTAPSSSATTATGAAAAAPPKKKRKTKEEKEAEEKERAAKKARREEELAVKAKEKAEKAKEKEAAKAAKQAEKNRVDAEKAERERKKKEDEEKKKRAQPSLFAFMKPKPATAGGVLGDVSPNKQPASSKLADGSPSRPKAKPADAAVDSPAKPEAKPEKSAYEKLFQSFFVKSDVTIAPTPFQMDEEAKTLKSQILDEYIRGERGEVKTKPFDPVSVFQLSGVPAPRGIQHLSVKKVMAELFGEPLDVIPGNRTESQQVRLTGVQDQLNSIPVKVISFYEDVRPPYVGTITSTPQRDIRKLARRPAGRLLKLNYDYDSEAEWEEEEGEDLDDDEVEDEDHEGDEEMADFLDDAEDTGAIRPAFLGETEPVSTGVCYEDRKRRALNADGEDCATVYKYRMEFLLDSLEHHHSIDPFSTQYWQPKVATAHGAAEPAGSGTQLKLTPSGKKAGMAPPPAPGSGPAAASKATSTGTPALTLQQSSQQAESTPDWASLMPKTLLKDFKKAVISPDVNFLTKAGIVDMLSQRFSSVTKNQVRATLDFVAERCAFPGEKKSAKRWVLRPEHALNKD